MLELPSYDGVTRFWHPVLASSALRQRPARVTVGARDYALFRSESGAPAALLDRCAHRFAPLTKGQVVRGRIECPYHGWSFAPDGSARSPARGSLTNCNVPSMRAIERHGYVWIADEGADEAAMPEVRFGRPFEFMGAFSTLFAAPLHVCLDNFSEDEHTPWVHTRLGWDARDAGSVRFEASNFDDRTEVRYRAPQRDNLAMRAFGITAGAAFCNDWVTRFDPVRTDYTITHELADGRPSSLTLRAVIFMVPEGARRTRFHVFVSASDRHPLRALALPALRPAVLALVRREIEDDARFIGTVANTPWSFEGMRLGRFDKPLVHNRKLLERIYLGRREPA